MKESNEEAVVMYGYFRCFFLGGGEGAPMPVHPSVHSQTDVLNFTIRAFKNSFSVLPAIVIV